MCYVLRFGPSILLLGATFDWDLQLGHAGCLKRSLVQLKSSYVNKLGLLCSGSVSAHVSVTDICKCCCCCC